MEKINRNYNTSLQNFSSDIPQITMKYIHASELFFFSYRCKAPLACRLMWSLLTDIDLEGTLYSTMCEPCHTKICSHKYATISDLTGEVDGHSTAQYICYLSHLNMVHALDPQMPPLDQTWTDSFFDLCNFQSWGPLLCTFWLFAFLENFFDQIL